MYYKNRRRITMPFLLYSTCYLGCLLVHLQKRFEWVPLRTIPFLNRTEPVLGSGLILVRFSQHHFHFYVVKELKIYRPLHLQIKHLHKVQQLSASLATLDIILQNDMMFVCIFNKIFRMNFQTAPVASILNRFSQTRYHFEAVSLLFPAMYKS